jgi:hypothetical protein
VATAVPDVAGQITLADPNPPADVAQYQLVAEFP